MKRFSIILVTILLVMTMFVSCSVEVNEPETNLMSLRFRTDDDASKALTASRDSFKPEDYYWFYTANKTDSTPATGTKTNETPVTKENDVHVKGLSGLVGPFSLGKWNFVLKAYTTSDSTTGVLVYSGTVTGYELTATTETINVVVYPINASGTGTLRVEKSIGFTANSETYTATNITVTNVDGTGSYTAISDGTAGYDANYDTFSLAVGSYKVTVAYIKDSVTYATNTIYVNVWNGLTTTISGSLDEITVYERFNATENEDGSLEQAVSINTTSSDTPTATNYVFNYSPASTNLSTIVKGTFTKTDGTTGDATLTVTTYDISSANSNSTFVVAADSNEVPVAGIDLTLTNAEFYTDSVAIITTTIAKGLTEPKLYHKTSDSSTVMTEVASADAVVSNGQWYYNSTDGTLVFATSSFSSFFVSSKDAFIDVTDNSALDKDALSWGYATNGGKVVLVRDINLDDFNSRNCFWFNGNGGCTNLTLDLAGHTVSFDNAYSNYVDGTEKGQPSAFVYGIENGTLKIINSSETTAKITSAVRGITIQSKSGTVEIGENITVEGKYSGVFIENSSTLNVYGTIKTTEVDTAVNKGGFAIEGNGGSNSKYHNTVINIYDGAVVTSESSTAIYHPQTGGTLNIQGGTITGKNAAVEMRAGTLNITGGTFSATATENCGATSNGSGATTVGAAIAVAQHTTKQNITVTISGGTFSGYNALSVQNPQTNSQEDCNKVSVTVTGGTFTSIATENPVISNVETTYFTASGDDITTASNATPYTVKGKTATN